MSDPLYKEMADFLFGLSIDELAHTGKTYLGHLLAVHRLMQEHACNRDACRAGVFHSIYGTEQFQHFQLPLERRQDVRVLIGERAEWLAYLNCAMDRASFDLALELGQPPYVMRDRITGQEDVLSREDFDDLGRVHLYDWLEQVPRSRHGYGYRRAAYRRLAERLGPEAVSCYDRVFAGEPVRPADIIAAGVHLPCLLGRALVPMPMRRMPTIDPSRGVGRSTSSPAMGLLS
jgi:hypothetical protein